MSASLEQGALGPESKSPESVAILYTNWRGETAVRRIVPGSEHPGLGALWLGESEWHPGIQWLLAARDVEKNAHRVFALSGIKAWGQAAVDAALSASAPASGAERMTAGEVTPNKGFKPGDLVRRTHVEWLVGMYPAFGETAYVQRVGGEYLYFTPEQDGLGENLFTLVTPAPATPPGVPDSLRALSEAFAETACCASCTTPLDCYQGKPCRLEPAGSRSGVVDHEFKSHPDVFWPAARGEKTFEYRRDDRGGYDVGQTVRLHCYDLTRGYHAVPPLERRITNILRGGEFELPQGYCILSLAPLDAQPAGQSELPILRVVVEVYPDRTDTRLTFGDRIRPEPGVKAVEQAISALQAEFDGRNACPAIKSSKRSPQETWISVSALQPQQKAMLGRWSQGAPNEDGSPHFYWQQCSGRYFDFQGERHWCLDGHRFEGAPFYGESPTHALIIAEPPPHGSWGNQVGQSEDDVERCIACDKPLKAGELVLPDAEGGTIHTACCGPERESYTGADGGPLGPNDPIPQGYVYEPGPSRPVVVCNGDPAGQSAGQAGDAGADARTVLTEACKPWEHYTGEPPDDGSPLSGVFVAGMVYTERLLAKLLDVAHYEGGDGSEDFDNDATQTLRNILTGAGLWDADENRAVKPAPDSTRTGDEGTEKRLQELFERCVAEASRATDKTVGEVCRWYVEQALAARPAAPRPIAEAPKDGTEIWAWLYDSGVRKLRWWSAEEICEEEGRGTPDAYQAGFYEVADRTEWWNPAWWFPADRLPAPPSSSGQGGR
ncbi:DUF3850 domain-containing protein [Methylorubrum aminovorans]|uniref:DUF3850 domain-containing protein n=1 Tax=Methylorubrum aminovorans TaxID=269069 RepID=UPI003C2B022E